MKHKFDPKIHKSYHDKGVLDFEYIDGVRYMVKLCTYCNSRFNAKQPAVKTCSINCAESQKSSKISKYKSGKPSWNSGKSGIYSEEVKRKMGAKNLGKTLSDSHRSNISKGLNNYYDHNKSKLSGRSLSDDHKSKIKLGLKSSNHVHTKFSFQDIESVTNELGLKIYEFNGAGSHDKLGLICQCGNHYIGIIQKLMDKSCYLKCPKCLNRESSFEFSFNEFLSSLNVPFEILKRKRPNFMDGKELDIWIPELNLAIELHGLVFHSERSVYKHRSSISPNLHLEKFEKCKSKGINLVQIFEDEWNLKRPIVESIIKHKLGMSNKLYARKCIVKKISNLDAKKFHDKNHISGSVISSLSVGLFYNNELVSVLSFRTPWTKSYGDSLIEISRFSSELNTTIIGGFSKMIKFSIPIIRSNGFSKILTYSDRRFGFGNVYEKSGFTRLSPTKPNYFYEKSGIRENRFKHKKNNDPDFIKKYGNTEKEQNNNQGWFAIYDAGSDVFTLDL